VFKEAEGPTALRAELVQALSLSLGSAEIETETGCEECCAALAGVWNGKKGFVALLVRRLERPSLQRWVYSEPLRDPKQVESAIEAGIDFAESLGFALDDSSFVNLGDAEKQRRLECWNDVRKLSRSPMEQIAVGSAAEESAAQAVKDAANGESVAILGRLSLVRRQDEPAIELIARLLSYF